VKATRVLAGAIDDFRFNACCDSCGRRVGGVITGVTHLLVPPCNVDPLKDTLSICLSTIGNMTWKKSHVVHGTDIGRK